MTSLVVESAHSGIARAEVPFFGCRNSNWIVVRHSFALPFYVKATLFWSKDEFGPFINQLVQLVNGLSLCINQSILESTSPDSNL